MCVPIELQYFLAEQVRDRIRALSRFHLKDMRIDKQWMINDEYIHIYVGSDVLRNNIEQLQNAHAQFTWRYLSTIFYWSMKSITNNVIISWSFEYLVCQCLHEMIEFDRLATICWFSVSNILIDVKCSSSYSYPWCHMMRDMNTCELVLPTYRLALPLYLPIFSLFRLVMLSRTYISRGYLFLLFERTIDIDENHLLNFIVSCVSFS
jgi:hypothetical protein